MIDWDDYRLLLAFSREGTVRAAATQLGVNHSTVSRRLAQLNDRLDTPALEKSASGYRLTALGTELAQAASEMETIALGADRRSRAADASLSGPISLSIPEVIGRHLLLDSFAAFERAHPDIKLTIHSSYAFADLDRSEADIVIRGTAKPPDHLVGRRLFPYALSFYSAPDYLDRVAPEDRRWVIGDNPKAARASIARSPFPEVPIGMVIGDIGLRHEAAARGHAMMIGACYIADPDPRLQRLPGSIVMPVPDFWVLTHPDLAETPRIRTLMRFICDEMTRHRDLIEGRLE